MAYDKIRTEQVFQVPDTENNNDDHEHVKIARQY